LVDKLDQGLRETGKAQVVYKVLLSPPALMSANEMLTKSSHLEVSSSVSYRNTNPHLWAKIWPHPCRTDQYITEHSIFCPFEDKKMYMSLENVYQ
jgi:hypothetical protein